MTIPENQLEIWANPGSQTKFKDAHESISKALKVYSWPDGVNYKVYLQGSYKNSTTIRSNSDVDVVVQLDSTFRSDLSRLTQPEKDAHNRDHPNATYKWENFSFDVFNALNRQNGLKSIQGNKCIKVETPYLAADVVVCMQYRLYKKYPNIQNQDYIEGMTFRSSDGWIVNYPKQHDDNGTIKSKYTNGNYYPTVRIFKNIKSRLVENDNIKKEDVPSYSIECLLYNVPHSKFESNCQNTVYNILSYLNNQNISAFKCQNGITSLFGNSTDMWNESNAKIFINEVTKFWNNW